MQTLEDMQDPVDSGLLTRIRTAAGHLEHQLGHWLREGLGQPFFDPAWIEDELRSDDLMVETVANPAGRLRVMFLAPQVDRKRIVQEVVEPLRTSTRADPRQDLPGASLATDPQEVLAALIGGKVAVFRGEAGDAALVDVRASRSRAITEATTEASLLGPKAAFTEDITTSLHQVRRLLATPRLRVRSGTLGTISRTKIATLWLDGVASPELVQDVQRRLKAMRTDVILSSQDLAQVAFHRTWSPFPTVQRTERPDRVAQGLALGRIAVIVDGSPFVLLVPVTLGALTKYLESYSGPPPTVVFVRWLRFLGGMMSMLAPAVYVALLSINPTLLPADTLVAVAQTRVGVPYPVLFETLGLLLILDMVIEASQQAPSPIGQTVTVVGGLIIGQAAVQAHLGSQMIIIVAAVVGIGTLLIPDLSLGYAIRIAKYPITILAGATGFFGLALAVIVILVHVVSLESMDVPYGTPFGPVRTWSLTTYSLLANSRGGRSLRPGTYGPQFLRRSPRGGREGP